jgi:hypothetical protein
MFESIGASKCTLPGKDGDETKYKVVNPPSTQVGTIKLKSDKLEYD